MFKEFGPRYDFHTSFLYLNKWVQVSIISSAPYMVTIGKLWINEREVERFHSIQI